MGWRKVRLCAQGYAKPSALQLRTFGSSPAQSLLLFVMDPNNSGPGDGRLEHMGMWPWPIICRLAWQLGVFVRSLAANNPVRNITDGMKEHLSECFYAGLDNLQYPGSVFLDPGE